MTIFSFDVSYIRLVFVKCPGEGSRFNHCQYYGSRKSYVNEFFNTSRCQILIWVCKVFCLFQQTFACEKVEGNIIYDEGQKFLRYSKKQTAQRNRVPSPIHDQSKNYQEKCCFYKIFTCNIQIMIYFFKKYHHPEPYSSLFSMLVRMYLIVNDFSFSLLYMT